MRLWSERSQVRLHSIGTWLSRLIVCSSRSTGASAGSAKYPPCSLPAQVAELLMFERAISWPEQRSTASKSDSFVKSESASPGQAPRFSHDSWQTMARPSTVRTRRMKRTGSPASSPSSCATSAGAGSTSFASTWVLKASPCSFRAWANESGRAPPGCATPERVTNVPLPLRWTRRPSSTSMPMARRTVPRDTP